MNYVNLHLHSAYSLLDSIIRIEPLVDRVVELGQKACSLTDHGNVAGAVKFTKACKERGIKPILGCEMYVAPDTRWRKKYEKIRTGEFDATTQKEILRDAHSASHLILLAKNEVGWKNLCTLCTLAYEEGFYKKPRIDHELLARYSEGLIATTACMGGDISVHLKAGLDVEGEGKTEFDPWLASMKFNFYVQHFGDDFYIELQDHGEGHVQDSINEWYRERYPDEMFIASNDCHYLTAAEYDVHDTFLCCNVVKHKNDPGRWRFPTTQAYLRSTEEMEQLFYPHELENTVKVADKIEFELPMTGTWFIPKLHKETLNGQTPEEVFTRECIAGLSNRLHGKEDPKYKARLDFEMAVFIKAGFCEYTLILWDLMDWCRRSDILTGDGRGSGAGSCVLYALGITNVDPVLRDCPFERFINPGRLENAAPPDVDLDFPQSRRQDVIEYLRQRYGENNVCQIGTYATLGVSALIQKLAVPLGIPPDAVNRLSRLVPEGVSATEQGSGAASGIQGLSMDEVWTKSDGFKKEIQKLGRVGESLMYYARYLQNLGSHASTHASGVVITDRPVRELMPLMVAKVGTDEELVLAQFDMGDVEKIGIIKFDMLGLGFLDMLKYVADKIKETEDPNFDWNNVDLDDPAAYDILIAGRTMGIFQAAGAGLGRLLPQAKPRNIEDLAILNSLCRPGPSINGDTDTYIRRRQKTEPVTYDFPQLEPYLKNSLGVIAFQEQIMNIAHGLAGFTLAEADELRKVMGKKQISRMPLYREKLIIGLEHTSNISPHLGAALWEKFVSMSQYVFNKSHAVAYSYLTAKGAWAKAHYPAYFTAGTLTVKLSTSGGRDDIPALVRDGQASGCLFARPDINRSSRGYEAVDRQTILLGLQSIRGVGDVSADAILSERAQNGAFLSLENARSRIPGRSASVTVWNALVQAGAFESLGVPIPAPEAGESALQMEFNLFGFFLSGHLCSSHRARWTAEFPDLTTIQEVWNDWRKIQAVRWYGNTKRQVWTFADRHIKVVVTKVSTRKSKKGNQGLMTMLEIEDETSSARLTIFAKQLELFGNPAIKKGMILDLIVHKDDPDKYPGYVSASKLQIQALGGA